MGYELEKIILTLPAFLFASITAFGPFLIFAILSYRHFLKNSASQKSIPNITLLCAFLAVGWSMLLMFPKGDGLQYAASVLMWMFIGFWVLLFIHRTLFEKEAKIQKNDEKQIKRIQRKYAYTFVVYILLLAFTFYNASKTNEWKLAQETSSPAYMNRLYEEALKKPSVDERDSIFLFITQNRRTQVVTSDLLLKMLAEKPPGYVTAQIAGHPSANESVACKILQYQPGATQYIKIQWNKNNCK